MPQRPTPIEIANGAYQDEIEREAPLLFLAGPIKHWWTCWGSPEHLAYIEHRESVRKALVKAGYLTVAPWEGLKGPWNRKAQAINDAAIGVSDAVLILTPPGIPADGTEEETELAGLLSVPRFRVIPGLRMQDLLDFLYEAVGPGVTVDTLNKDLCASSSTS